MTRVVLFENLVSDDIITISFSGENADEIMDKADDFTRENDWCGEWINIYKITKEGDLVNVTGEMIGEVMG